MADHRSEPSWLDLAFALAVHDRQLAEHGGPSGIRDQGALESALSRPRNQWAYGEEDPAALAAAYAFGIARNHPFTDGNKRTAWVLARVFLLLNDHRLKFDKVDALQTVQALAAGELSDDELADWFRQRLSDEGA
ncbi:type II toxin-antitoxin system death-on-curing family toxin [Aurantiacibacter aquimixticola]|uniref:Type II toxin-antitoxin system death-on-curing family toxin n=1 Tax=Aurantiacibacter aquimixticola TaxID=1958945 RepID=A0A419RW56_9SPHN|nr:type II toxin-antitoxin system death-on-curing family toxin [Aurantiacibacter aquimixticola]RJY09997.1 type II toxin-antitoxin system death-on-curing family toxin [Aurantiacibacter aquimixticola]